jgi:hypothetical protein
MLSFFPALFTYEFFAPVILRLTLGVVFLYWASKGLKKGHGTKLKTYSVIELLLGLIFVVGFYVQVAALVAAVIFIVRLVQKIKAKSFFTDGVNYFFLLLVISLSLMVLGAGAFAFDLPL